MGVWWREGGEGFYRCYIDMWVCDQIGIRCERVERGVSKGMNAPLRVLEGFLNAPVSMILPRFSLSFFSLLPLDPTSPFLRYCKNPPIHPAVPDAFPQSQNTGMEQKQQTLTFVNPISWLFSLKHWRQILRPYFRIRPALCVHTRLSS